MVRISKVKGTKDFDDILLKLDEDEWISSHEAEYEALINIDDFITLIAMTKTNKFMLTLRVKPWFEWFSPFVLQQGMV